MWYPVRAQLAGIDPWSDSPPERMRYAVFQRQMSVEVAANRAQVVASINPEKAKEAMEEYMNLELPVDPRLEGEAERRKERLMEEVANMGPIPLSEIRIGNAIGGSGIAEVPVDRRKAPEVKTFGTGRA